MKHKTTYLAGIGLALSAVVTYGVYQWQSASTAATEVITASAAEPAASTPQAAATQEALPQTVAQGEDATRRHLTQGIKAGDVDPVNGGKVLYYQDPMVPGNKFDKPGKSPFMDMMLVPVYANQESDEGHVTVSARVQQNLGVRTALVTQGRLQGQLTAVGNIAFNERDQALVQSRALMYVERVHVSATLDKVTKGQALADVYVPDWVAAQEEFFSAKRLQAAGLTDLVDAARQRMRQVGMSEAQIQAIEQTGQVQARTTLTAPVAGVVVEHMAREGMSLAPGATLFRIQGLSRVWAHAEVPERQISLLRPGVEVQAHIASEPDVFKGQVQAVLPEVNATTRTVKVRMDIANPQARLLPGMFVQMKFIPRQGQEVVLIPSEAVIQTGQRTVVLLAQEGGKFKPLEIQVGREVDGQTEVKRGLQAGQQVVVSSQFLIDSEASLKGVEARLNGNEGAQP